MIELKDITKIYKMQNADLTALDHVNVRIDDGSFVALKGPSGSGKSSLLNILGLVDIPSSGEYLLDGKPMQALNAKQRSVCRKQYLGFIFQNYNLIPELSVYENVEIPLIIAGVKKNLRKPMTEGIIEEVGLKNHIKHRPGELSGGQQQRVAIARALVRLPPLVIADEPTANLDSKTGREIVSLMRDMNERHGISFIFATHDELILEYMKRIIYLRDGKVTDETKGKS